MNLGDLLTDKEFKEIATILKEQDYTKRMKALKSYLKEREKELLAKGVVSDYLAYLLEHIRRDILRGIK